MKYTKKQLRLMIKDYLTKVNDGWLGKPPDDEIDEEVKSCRYSFVEDYSWHGGLPSVDVLFLLIGDLKNYQAFTIEGGKLVELHQEHLAEYCLTCLDKENENEQAEPTTTNNYF